MINNLAKKIVNQIYPKLLIRALYGAHIAKSLDIQEKNVGRVIAGHKNSGIIGIGPWRVDHQRDKCMCVNTIWRWRWFWGQAKLNKEEAEGLRNFLGTLEKCGATSSCSIVLLGKTQSHTVKVSDKIHYGSWIINLGATYYITYNSKNFISYITSFSNWKIIIANWTSIIVAGQGNVHIN